MGHTVPKQVITIANVNSNHYSLSTALCESIRYQAKSEQNVRQDLIPRVGHGEAVEKPKYYTIVSSSPWTTSHPTEMTQPQ